MKRTRTREEYFDCCSSLLSKSNNKEEKTSLAHSLSVSLCVKTHNSVVRTREHHANIGYVTVFLWAAFEHSNECSKQFRLEFCLTFKYTYCISTDTTTSHSMQNLVPSICVSVSVRHRSVLWRRGGGNERTKHA